MATGYGMKPVSGAGLPELSIGHRRRTGRTGEIESESDILDPWRQQRRMVGPRPDQLTPEYLQSSFVFNVMDYGAVGDGVANDTTAIQDAIDAANLAGGGTVWFPRGIYLCLSLVGKANVSYFGEQGAVLRKNGGTASTHILDIKSTNNGSAINGTATNAVGDVVLDFPGTGNFVAGDYALLYDSTFEYSTLGRNQEIVRVSAVAAATVTVQDNIIRTYLLANSPKLQKLNMIHDISVHGLKFDVPTGTSGGCLWLELLTSVAVEDCTFVGADEDPCITVSQCSYIWINDVLFEDTQTQTSGRGYGIGIWDSSHHVLVSNTLARNIREHNVTNGCRLVAFIGNVVHGATASGLNTHGTGNRRVLFADNHLSGCNIGIAVGHNTAPDHDEDVSIIGNRIEQSDSAAIQTSTDGTDDNTGILIANNAVFWSNTVFATTYCITVKNSDNVAVIGNYLDPVDANCLGGVGFIDALNCSVLSNHFRNIPNGYGIYYQGVCNGLRMANNALYNIGLFDIFDNSAGLTTQGFCEYNWADAVNVSIGTGTRRRGNRFDNLDGISANIGDADNSPAIGTSFVSLRYASTLTANRTVTLPTANVFNGARFRVFRTGLGAFTLNVGGLKTIPASTAAFVDVEHDGTAWRLTGYGTL